MESVLVANALQLFTHLCIPVLGAIVAGAVLSGVLRVATQIEDASIQLAGKLCAVAVLFTLTGNKLSQQVMQLAMRLWGGADFYH